MVSSRESTGLFLGLVTSSFELSSPTYIFSKGFRACFLRLGSLSKMDIATLLLHIYLFILAASAGPSSAIAMLPKLGSWSFPNGFHAVMGETISSLGNSNSTKLLGIYIQALFPEIYPTRVTAEFSSETCDYSYLANTTINSPTCPRDTSPSLVNGLPGLAELDLYDATQFPDSVSFNITAQAGYFSRTHNVVMFPALAGGGYNVVPTSRRINITAPVAYAINTGQQHQHSYLTGPGNIREMAGLPPNGRVF